MRNDIIQRTMDVIRSSVSERRRLKELEEETGIPAGNWKNVWNGKQRPTAHMIEALARRWPQYAFWLATGITDEANGHTAPPDAWTCGQMCSAPEIEQRAVDYFDFKIFMQDSVYGMNGSAESNYVEKKNPSEEELIEANKLDHRSDDPEVQTLIDLFFGKEVKVYKKKFTDLDYAIARISFDKRLKSLAARFFELKCSETDYEQYQKLLDELQKKRLKVKSKNSK